MNMRFGKTVGIRLSAAIFAIILLACGLLFANTAPRAGADEASESSVVLSEEESDISNDALSENAPSDSNSVPSPTTEENAAVSNDSAEESEANKRVIKIATVDDFAEQCRKGGNLILTADLTFNAEDYARIVQAYPNDPAIITITEQVKVDLNDKTITVSSLESRPFIDIKDGGSLELGKDYDLAPMGGGIYGAKTSHYNMYSLVTIEKGGSFKLCHDICRMDHNTAISMRDTGLIINHGEFVLSGNGSITYCDAGTQRYCIYNDGTMTVENGVIAHCNGVDTNVIQNSGTLNLEQGSVISYCTAEKAHVYWGKSGSTVNFAGTISNCKAQMPEGQKGNFTLLYLDAGANMQMTGGTIFKNACVGAAGAIMVGNAGATTASSFTMSGGKISDNVSVEGMGHIYVEKNGVASLKGGSITGSDSATQGSCVNVAQGGSLVLSGAQLKSKADEGHVSTHRGGMIYTAGSVEMTKGSLDGDGAESTQGGLIYVANTGVFKMTGGSLVNGLSTADNQGNKGAGGAIYSLGGTVEIGLEGDSVSVEDCLADNYGGAIYQEGGSLTLGPNAAICGCSAGDEQTEDKNSSCGGALYLTGGASATLQSGSEISECSALTYGGAVYAEAAGTVTVQAGANVTKNAALCGGGIAIKNKATLNLAESITGNSAKKLKGLEKSKATAAGGGVIVIGAEDSASAPTLNFCGGAIYSNSCQAGSAKDLYLDYLNSSSPNASEHIKATAAPAGFINTVEQTAASSKVTSIYVEAGALGTGNEYWGRVFLSGAASSFKNYTLENAAVARLFTNHEGHIVIVKDAAQIKNANDLKTAASRGGTFFLAKNIEVKGQDLANPVTIDYDSPKTVFALEATEYTINYTCTTCKWLFQVDSGVFALYGNGTTATIMGPRNDKVEESNLIEQPFYGAIHVAAEGTLNMQGATIENCFATDVNAVTGDEYCGGAITVGGGKVNISKNSHIKSCLGPIGAIAVYGGSLTMEDSTIENCACSATGKAAAIALMPSTSLFSKKSTATLNRISCTGSVAQGKQSAVWVASGNTLHFNNATLEGTNNALYGSCVCVDENGTFYSRGSTLKGGSAGLGGCIYNNGSVKLVAVGMQGGTACCGGAIYQANGSLSLEDTNFYGCKASSTQPLEKAATERCRVSSSYYKGCGGALYINYAEESMDLKKIAVSGCEADCAGGGMFVNIRYRPAFGKVTPLSVSGKIVDCKAGLAGGALCTMTGIVTLQDMTQENNTAPYGGGTCQLYNTNMTLQGSVNIFRNSTGTEKDYNNYFFDATMDVYNAISDGTPIPSKVEEIDAGTAADAKVSAEAKVTDVDAKAEEDDASQQRELREPTLDTKTASGTVCFSIMADQNSKWPYKIARLSNNSEGRIFVADNAGYDVKVKDQGAFLVKDSDSGWDPGDEDDNSGSGGGIVNTGDSALPYLLAATALCVALTCLFIRSRRKEQ